MIDRLRLVGGAERLQYSFAEAARDHDVDLTVLTLQPGDPEAEREVAALGARVVRFDSHRFGSLRRARALRRFLAEERFDVLHTHLVRSTILGAAIARTLDLPVVATIHNTKRNSRLPRALDLAEAFVLRHWTDRVIAVGWETARAHASRLGEQSTSSPTRWRRWNRWTPPSAASSDASWASRARRRC
jgi:glycosyltransferase involved in cell wall biosynthesis